MIKNKELLDQMHQKISNAAEITLDVEENQEHSYHGKIKHDQLVGIKYSVNNS